MAVNKTERFERLVYRSLGMFVVVGLLVIPLAAADPKGGTKEERIAKTRADLSSPDAEPRLAAVRSLPHNDIAAALIPELIKALQDSNGEVRSWTATVLGPQGGAARETVPALIAQLEKDPVKEARETAARALGRIGRAVPEERRAVEPLRRAAAQDEDSVTRVVALGALALMEHDTPAQVVAIREYLSHADALTRMKAAHALGYLGDRARAAAPQIAAALERDTDPYQRGYLARSLGQIGDPAVLPVLLAQYERETDSRALGEMRGAIQRLGGKAPPKK